MNQQEIFAKFKRGYTRSCWWAGCRGAGPILYKTFYESPVPSSFNVKAYNRTGKEEEDED